MRRPNAARCARLVNYRATVVERRRPFTCLKHLNAGREASSSFVHTSLLNAEPVTDPPPRKTAPECQNVCRYSQFRFSNNIEKTTATKPAETNATVTGFT